MQKGKLHIADDGGKGGVRVNGRNITQQAITEFDEIELGQSQLKIEISFGGGSHQDTRPKSQAAQAPEPEPEARTARVTAASPIAPAPSIAVRRVRAEEESIPTASNLQQPADDLELTPPPTPRGPARTVESPFSGMDGEQTGADEVTAMRTREDPRLERELLGKHEEALPKARTIEPEKAKRPSVAAEPPKRPSVAAPPPPPARPSAAPSRQREDAEREGKEPARSARSDDSDRRKEASERRSEATSDRRSEAREAANERGAKGPVRDDSDRPTKEVRKKAEPEKASAEDRRKPDAAPPHHAPDHELDHDEEEELEELNFVPSFSLLENIVRESFESPIRAEPDVVAEVIAYRDSRLLDVVRLDRGKTFTVFDPTSGARQRLFRARRAGRVRVTFDGVCSGSVVVGGQTTSLEKIRAENAATKGEYALELTEGDCAHIKRDGAGYLLRFVRSPMPPPRALKIGMAREDRTYVGLGFIGMLAMVALLWIQAIIAPRELLAMEEEVQFAEVSLKELELTKPEEPKPPEPPKEVEPPPPPEPPKETVAEKPKREKPKKEKRSAKRSPQPSQASPPPDPAAEQAAQALAALAAVGPSSAKTDLSKVVSNIAAVRAPKGSSRQFKVEGAIGKLPGDDAVLALGKAGRDTRAAAKLLEGAKVGDLSGGGGKPGQVRGKVARLPEREVKSEGGSLSRSAILKVINEGIADVQRCYERELMKNPGLQGKVIFDWVIGVNGEVTSARVRSATLDSPKANACIAEVIRGWTFPKPVGGTVAVTFPFVFQIQGF